MTRNSRSTIAHVYREGMDVVCMYDHQLHDKLNYLNRYKVLSVEKLEDGSVWLEVMTRFHNKDTFPAEYFVPLWYFEGKDQDPWLSVTQKIVTDSAYGSVAPAKNVEGTENL